MAKPILDRFLNSEPFESLNQEDNQTIIRVNNRLARLITECYYLNSQRLPNLLREKFANKGKKRAEEEAIAKKKAKEEAKAKRKAQVARKI